MGAEANDLKIFQDLQKQKTDLYRSMDKCFTQVKNSVSGQNLYNDVLKAAEEFENNKIKVLFLGVSEKLKEMYQANLEAGGNEHINFSYNIFEGDPLEYVINYKEYPDILIGDNDPEAYEKMRRRFTHSQIFVVGTHEDEKVEETEEIAAEAELGESIEDHQTVSGDEVMELAVKDPEEGEDVPLTDRDRRRLEREQRRMAKNNSANSENGAADGISDRERRRLEREKRRAAKSADNGDASAAKENESTLTDRERRRLEREKNKASNGTSSEIKSDENSESNLSDRERRRLEREKRRSGAKVTEANSSNSSADDTTLTDRERRRLERQKAKEEEINETVSTNEPEKVIEEPETPPQSQEPIAELKEEPKEEPQKEMLAEQSKQESDNGQTIQDETPAIEEKSTESNKTERSERRREKREGRERNRNRDRGDRSERGERRERSERGRNSDQSPSDGSSQENAGIVPVPVPTSNSGQKESDNSGVSRVEERRSRRQARPEQKVRESTSERLRASERRERDMVQPKAKKVLDLNVDPKEIKIPKNKFLTNDLLLKDFIDVGNIRDSTFILKSYYSNKIGQISKLMEFFVKSKEVEGKRIKGKMILNNKDLSEIRSTDTRGMSRESSNVKGDLSKKIRILQRQFEAELDKVQFDEEGFVQLIKKEISDYQGLLEVESGKTITIDISDGYAKDLESNALKGLTDFVEGTAKTIITNVTSIQNELKNYLKEKKIEGPIIPKVSMSDMPTEDYCTLEPIETANFTKSFNKKGGMYQLFMELRTPMFMMMPLMMVGSLFGALLVGSDNGAISPKTHDEYGEQIVMIDRFPEYFAQNGTKEFITSFEEVVQKKGRESNYFIGNWASNGERRKKETFELNYKEQGGKVILFVSDSREKAVEQLTSFYDSKLGGGKRVSMGYSAIFGIISKYSQFRYYIFGALMLAIFMFSKKKIKEQALEKEVNLEKERRSIKNSLSQGLERGVSTQISSWKSFVNDFLKTKQDMLVGITEKLVDKKVETATYDVNNKKKIIDQRQKNFQKAQKTQADLIKSLEQIVNDLKPMEKHLFKK